MDKWMMQHRQIKFLSYISAFLIAFGLVSLRHGQSENVSTVGRASIQPIVAKSSPSYLKNELLAQRPIDLAEAAAARALEEQKQRELQAQKDKQRALEAAARPTKRASRSNSAIESCIVTSESHGNYYPNDNPTHFGKYQYDRSTWVAHGGNAADWGTASPEEQERVFRNGVNKFGYGAWTPYDGC